MTDKLPSYKAALRELGCNTPHITKQYENNIAEISHQRARQTQRQMRQFISMAQAQRFYPVTVLLINTLGSNVITKSQALSFT